MYMLFLPMLYRVICVCIDLCTLCENNKKINDKKKKNPAGRSTLNHLKPGNITFGVGAPD